MSTEAKTQKTLADYDKTLGDLQARLEQNQKEAGAIPSSRGELALAAAEGDSTAFDKMRELEAQEQTLAIEAKNINAAIARAEELRAPLVEAENRKALKARRVTAGEKIGRYVEASAAVDAALIALREALAARQVIGEELHAYQWSRDQHAARDWAQLVYSQTVSNAPNFLIHASATAGLSDYLPHVIPRIAESDHMTLAERAKRSLQLPADRADHEDL